MNCEGFQSVDCKMSGLPLRIVYQSPRYEHLPVRIGNDDGFEGLDAEPTRVQIDLNTARRRLTIGPLPFRHLDPYAIRRKFEAIENRKDACRFLCEAGRFWPFRRVLWRQFQEWQRYFEWLRQEPKDVMQTPDGERAWNTAGGYINYFFESKALFSPEEIEEIGPKRMREIEQEAEQKLCLLRSFALSLGGLPKLKGIGHPNRITLAWYDPKDEPDPADGGAPENWLPHRLDRIARGVGRDWRPMAYLRIEVGNVLEAIAATIYADRAVKLKYRKCAHKPCSRLFLFTNKKQKYCPHPNIPGESLCKKAHMREKERNAPRS